MEEALYVEIRKKLDIAELIAEQSPSLYARYRVAMEHSVDLCKLVAYIKNCIHRQSVRKKMTAKEYNTYILLLVHVIDMRGLILHYMSIAKNNMIEIVPSDTRKPLPDEYFWNIKDCSTPDSLPHQQ